MRANRSSVQTLFMPEQEGRTVARICKSTPIVVATSTMAAQMPSANIEACEMIEDMLYEMIPSLDKSKANRLARQLASLRAFRSLDSNTEKGCLKVRIKNAAQMILDIAERRRSRASSVASNLRTLPTDGQHAEINCHHILLKTVGEPKYNEIVSVYREIKEIREKSAVWTKFTQQRASEEEELAPASESLPAPISNIYFRTRLINAMRIVDAEAPRQQNGLPERTCFVQELDWDSILRDGKANLAAFRKFVKENVDENEILSFQCNGICLLPTCRK